MIKKRFILLLIYTSTLLFGSELFIHQKFGSRAVAMGGAYTAISEDSEQLFYNVAKPSLYDSPMYKVEYSTAFETPVYAFSSQLQVNSHPIGLGYIYSSEKDIPLTSLNEHNQPVDSGSTFINDIHGLLLSTRTRFSFADIGIRGHLFREYIKDDVGTGLGLDLAAYKSISLFNQPFSFGATLKNIAHTGVSWSTGHTDTVPLITTVGTASKFFDERLILAIDIEKIKNYDLDSYLGTEFWILGGPKEDGSLAIRAGSHRSDLTLGIGFITEGLIFDYSYRNPSLSILDQDHRFSIGWTSFPFTRRLPEQHYAQDTLQDSRPRSNITYTRPSYTRSQPKPQSEPIPKAVLVGKLLYLPQENPVIKFEDIYKDFQLSTSTQAISVSENTPYALTYPLSLTCYIPQEQQRISLLFEKNSTDHFILSGTLPPSYYIFINGAVIIPNQANEFFFKTPISHLKEEQVLEFLIFKNTEKILRN